MIARLALAAALCASPGQACTAIILGVDHSSSIDNAEFDHMRRGIAAALVDPSIIEAATGGDYQIAVFFWSSAQTLAVSWTPINSEAELHAAAGAILAASRPQSSFLTGTGDAMRYGVALGEATDCSDIKLNIVSDGTSTVGANPHVVRDGLTSYRVQINGVAIGSGAEWMRNNVMYGSGAFVEVADDFGGFRDAMVRKLNREMVMGALQ